MSVQRLHARRRLHRAVRRSERDSPSLLLFVDLPHVQNASRYLLLLVPIEHVPLVNLLECVSALDKREHLELSRSFLEVSVVFTQVCSMLDDVLLLVPAAVEVQSLLSKGSNGPVLNALALITHQVARRTSQEREDPSES